MNTLDSKVEFLITLLGSLAQEEDSNISQITRMGIAYCLRAGLRLGRFWGELFGRNFIPFCLIYIEDMRYWFANTANGRVRRTGVGNPEVICHGDVRVKS